MYTKPLHPQKSCKEEEEGKKAQLSHAGSPCIKDSDNTFKTKKHIFNVTMYNVN